MIYKKIPIVNLLKQLDPEVAKRLIIVIVNGVISTLKMGSLTIIDSEKLIFNLDILNYCETYIQDEKLFKIISYGMELSDIESLVKRDEILVKAYNEIERQLGKISYKDQDLIEQ